MKAKNLKKGFFGKPNPRVKISVIPRVRHIAAYQNHHGLQGKTLPKQNTTDPVWETEVSSYYFIMVLERSLKGFLCIGPQL